MKGQQCSKLDFSYIFQLHVFSSTDLVPQTRRKISNPATEGPSYYLCLQVAKPKNKTVSDDCPFESYAKMKKPVYWFSIPASQ